MEKKVPYAPLKVEVTVFAETSRESVAYNKADFKISRECIAEAKLIFSDLPCLMFRRHVDGEKWFHFYSGDYGLKESALICDHIHFPIMNEWTESLLLIQLFLSISGK